MNSFFVQLHTATSNGDADIRGTLDLNRKTYDLVAHTFSGSGIYFKQDSLLGKFTLDATAKVPDLIRKMNSLFHVNLADAEIKSYNYKGLLLTLICKMAMERFIRP